MDKLKIIYTGSTIYQRLVDGERKAPERLYFTKAKRSYQQSEINCFLFFTSTTICFSKRIQGTHTVIQNHKVKYGCSHSSVWMNSTKADSYGLKEMGWEIH